MVVGAGTHLILSYYRAPTQYSTSKCGRYAHPKTKLIGKVTERSPGPKTRTLLCRHGYDPFFFIRFNSVYESLDSSQLTTRNGFLGIDSNRLMTQKGSAEFDSN